MHEREGIAASKLALLQEDGKHGARGGVVDGKWRGLRGVSTTHTSMAADPYPSTSLAAMLS